MSRNQLPIMQLNKRSLDALDANTKAMRELTEEFKRQRRNAATAGDTVPDHPMSGTATGGILKRNGSAEHEVAHHTTGLRHGGHEETFGHYVGETAE